MALHADTGGPKRAWNVKRLLLVVTLISAAFLAAYALAPERGRAVERIEPTPAPEVVAESQPEASAGDAPTVSAEPTAAPRANSVSPTQTASGDATSGYEARTCKGYFIIASLDGGIQRATVDIRSAVPIYVTLQADVAAELAFSKGVEGFDRVGSPDLGFDEDLSASGQLVSLAPLSAGGYSLYSGSRWIGSITVRE